MTGLSYIELLSSLCGRIGRPSSCDVSVTRWPDRTTLPWHHVRGASERGQTRHQETTVTKTMPSAKRTDLSRSPWQGCHP